MKKMLTALICPVLALISINAGGQKLRPLDELSRAMNGSVTSLATLDPGATYIDCSTMDVDRLEALPDAKGGFIQWIYNNSYSWATVETGLGKCVLMKLPEHRGLTLEEAAILFSASAHRFPTDNPPPGPDAEKLTPARPDSDQDIRIEFDKDGRPAKKQRDPGCKENSDCPPDSSAPQVRIGDDNRYLVSTGDFPYFASTLVEQIDGEFASYSSAIQISRYVWFSAAHTIYSRSTHTRLSGFFVRPRWRMPDATNRIPVTPIIDEGFATSDDDQAKAHDVSFFRSTTGYMLPSYPKIFVIEADSDCIDVNYDYVANPFCDPWYVNDPGAPGIRSFYFNKNALIGDNTTSIVLLGYPAQVRTINNTARFDAYGADGDLRGVPSGFKLYHPCGNCLSVIGGSGYVSEGDSGGPILALDRRSVISGGSIVSATIVGLIDSYGVTNPLNENISYFIGSGRFDYNNLFYYANAIWTPGYPIEISNPQEGSTYDSASIPDFSASASVYTSDLQWSSSIDGALGSGGSVPVSGRLSPGMHTITVTMGTPPSAAATGSAETSTAIPYGIQTRAITVTAAAASLAAVPNPVSIAPGQSVGYTTISWNSPAYDAVELRLTLNGTRSVVSSGGRTGSQSIPVLAGNSYVFDLLRAGTSTVLASATVTTVVGASVTASPNPVPVSTSTSTGTTKISWDGQSYHSIDLRTSVDGADYLITASGTQTGSIQVPWIVAGHTYRFAIYPHNDVANQLAFVDVAGMLDVIFSDGFGS